MKRTRTSPAIDHPSISKKIEIALVENLYAQAVTGFAASIICATILLAALYNHNQSNVIIYSWYGFVILLNICRAILIHLFKKDTNKNINIHKWRRAFIVGALLSGISWGLTGSPLILNLNHEIQGSLTLVILAGIAAGSVPLLSSIIMAAFAFLIPALVPLIIHSFIMNNTMYLLLDLAFTVYLIYLCGLAFKTHEIIKQSFKLQYENDLLLKNLSNAKNELEITNRQLEKLATLDPLTSIGNRYFFVMRLTEALKQAKQKNQSLALLYLDLDNFKKVNDLYGHKAGDQLLLIVVERIQNILKEKDIISRLGGDELTIILENVHDPQIISEIAYRICKVVEQPARIDTHKVQVYASIGISIYPNNGTDIETLLKHADIAMYYAKEHGGNNYHFYVEKDTINT